MADYTELKGLKVKYLDSDPSPGTAGDVWYNTTTGQLKSFLATTAFSASSPVLTARSYGGSAGTQTANVFFGGEIYPNPNASTEEYDGTGWTASNNMNVGRGSIGGFGIQTAAVAVAGTHPAPSDIVANVEEYNGSSWTAGNNYPASVTNSNGSGTLTSGIQMGGHTATANQDASNEYDGTNWTSGGDMNSARNAFMAATQGTQTATLAAGGGTANCETYDGSSWTEVGNLPVSCGNNKGGGTQTNAVSYGGEPPGGVPAGVEAYTWDGTSWTASANMAKHRIQLAGSGTATAALAISGVQPGLISDTEEWHNTFKVVTAGAWASGGNINQARDALGGAGTQTAGLVFGGDASLPGGASAAPQNKSEEYDGSSWTEGDNLNTARSSLGGAGTQTAGLGFGGYTYPNNRSVASEEYNGSSWTEGDNLNQSRANVGGLGLQTAAIAYGGRDAASPPNSYDNTESYDGSSWTALPTLNQALQFSPTAGGGTTTAAVVTTATGSPLTDYTEEYNGSAWSDVGKKGTARYNVGGAGTQTAFLAFGGGPNKADTEEYDGTSWATRPSLATGRHTGAGGGTSASAFYAGGASPDKANTEEFTAETTADTAKTIDFD